MRSDQNSTSGNGKLTPYEWQRAILASDLPSTTKLVLMALSTHINKETGLAFPSIRMLMKEVSLGSEAVVKHIGNAKKAGWIEIGNHGYQDQRWARKSYRPRIPVNLKEGVSPSKTPYDVKGVSIEREGVSIEPPFQEAENALEPASTVAFSNSPAAPNNILTREEQERERGELSPSNFSFSSMEELPEAGGNIGLGCQDQVVLEASTNKGACREVVSQGHQVVHEVHQTAGESPEAAVAKRDPYPSDPIPTAKAATKGNGKPTTEKKRQHQGNGAGQPSPVPRAFSDDDIKAAMQETGWSEAKVKDEAPKFRDYHLSKGTLSHDWLAEWRIWKRRGDEWESREREHMRANGRVERTAPRPPVFVAEPRVPMDPSKPRPSHMPMLLAEIARVAAQP